MHNHLKLINDDSKCIIKKTEKLRKCSRFYKKSTCKNEQRVKSGIRDLDKEWDVLKNVSHGLSSKEKVCN